MADVSCGPSNALSSFQKHASADRTLQQDRLTTRGGSTQLPFRSHDPNAGLLDPEFEAFQAQQPLALGGQPLHHPVMPFRPAVAPQQPPSATLPPWAADFQRLHIAPSPSPVHAAAPAVGASSWHQDFLAMRQQPSPAASASSPMSPQAYQPRFQQPMFNSYAIAGNASPSMQQQVPQPSMSMASHEESAAFDKAFDEVAADVVMDDRANRALADYREQLAANGQNFKEMLNGQKEQTVIQPTSPVQASQPPPSMSKEEYNEQLRLLEQQGRKRLRMARLQERDYELGQEQLKQQDPSTLKQYTFVPIDPALDTQQLEQQQQPQEPQPQVEEPAQEEAKEQKDPDKEADDLARTAGELLSSVADNTSAKFQDSHFLALMRRLRDREVQVQGDAMVDVTVPDRPRTPEQTQYVKAWFHSSPSSLEHSIANPRVHYKNWRPNYWRQFWRRDIKNKPVTHDYEPGYFK